MTTTEFQAELAPYVVPAQLGNPLAVFDDLQARIDETRTKARELGVARDGVNELVDRLMAAAEVRWMRTRYATLDTSFADKKQNLLVARDPANPDHVQVVRALKAGETPTLDKVEAVIEVPVFATVATNYDRLSDLYDDTANNRWDRGLVYQNAGWISLPAVRLAGINYRAGRYQLTARCPEGITPALFTQLRQAIAHLNAFRLVGFARGLDLRNDLTRALYDVTVELLWAPIDTAWTAQREPERPVGDPAILLRSGNTRYLVGYYDTPDEKPIEHLLREFTDGPIGDVIPAKSTRKPRKRG